MSERGLIVADTMVVNYFTLVGEFELLRRLLGGTVFVPRDVFDPDEDDDVAEEIASELRRGLRVYRRWAGEEPGSERHERAVRGRANLERILDHARDGHLVPLDLTLTELDLFTRFRGDALAERLRLSSPLGRGEAAALAIALSRDAAIATDDTAAIAVGRENVAPADGPSHPRTSHRRRRPGPTEPVRGSADPHGDETSGLLGSRSDRVDHRTWHPGSRCVSPKFGGIMPP